MVWALVAGPIAGLVSVGFVRMIAWADRNKPQGWLRLVAPAFALGLLGVVSIRFPQLLGNGKDIADLAFTGNVAPMLLLALVVPQAGGDLPLLRQRSARRTVHADPDAWRAARRACWDSAWSLLWPGAPAGLFASIGAGAVLAATTHGPSRPWC